MVLCVQLTTVALIRHTPTAKLDGPIFSCQLPPILFSTTFRGLVNRLLRIVLMLALYALLPTLLSAQADRGGITGPITYNTAALLASTPIPLRNEVTGVVQPTVTDSAGVYAFAHLN